MTPSTSAAGDKIAVRAQNSAAGPNTKANTAAALVLARPGRPGRLLVLLRRGGWSRRGWLCRRLGGQGVGVALACLRARGAAEPVGAGVGV